MEIPIGLKISKNNEVYYIFRDIQNFYSLRDNNNRSISYYIRSNLKTYYEVFSIENKIAFSPEYYSSLDTTSFANEVRKNIRNYRFPDFNIEFLKEKFEYNYQLNNEFYLEENKIIYNDNDFEDIDVLTVDNYLIDYNNNKKIPLLFGQDTNLNKLLVNSFKTSSQEDYFKEKLNPIFFIEGGYYYILNSRFKIVDFLKIGIKNFHIGINEKNIKNTNIYFKYFQYPSKGIKSGLIKDIYNTVGDYALSILSDKNSSFLFKKRVYSYSSYEQLYNDLKKNLQAIFTFLYKELDLEIGEDYLFKIKKIDSFLVKDLVRNCNLININDIKYCAFHKVNYGKYVEKIDNNSNRIIKFILKKILRNIDDIKILGKKDNDIKKNIKIILKKYISKLNVVKDIKEIKLSNHILYNKTYFKIYEIYLRIFRSEFIDFLNKNTNVGFVKSINDIYEVYCFIKLNKVLQSILLEYNVINKFVNYDNTVISFKKYEDNNLEGYVLYNKKGRNKVKVIFGDSISSNKKYKNGIYINRDNTEQEKNYKNILGDNFDLGKRIERNNKFLTPDISIEIYENEEIKKVIIMDVKFSSFLDINTYLEYPNPEYFKEELHKYRKIGYFNEDGVFVSYPNTIYILYPGYIKEEQLSSLKTLNELIQKKYNMCILPIENNDDKIYSYLRDLLKKEFKRSLKKD